MSTTIEGPEQQERSQRGLIRVPRRLFFLVLLFVGGVVVLLLLLTALNQRSTMAAAPDREGTLTIPISLYMLVDDAQNPDPVLSSVRTEAELRQIVEGMNEIWAQADIQFEVQTIGALQVPPPLLSSIGAGRFRSFYASDLEVPGMTTITGFYARSIGGPNGINPFSSRTYFVMDQPSVDDHRVSAHEVGHILGLHHVLEDDNHLLSPGVNGMLLDEEEIAVARYVAWGIINNLR